MTSDGITQPDGRGVGLRTFLIADVRGYTAYTRTEGDEAAGRLAERFAATVREVVEARDGFLLELRGDEALVVFESSRQALRAAVELQTKLRDVGFPKGVGVGLDAGEAVAVEDGFRGGALNLAARLCSQARSGEILASETVIHLAARIEGLAYVDARMLNLKGFAEPVRAVEVVAADRVRTGLSRRMRRARYGLRSHRRLALVAALVVLVLGATTVIATLPPPKPPPTLADLPSGTVLIDAATGSETATIPTSTIKSPVEALHADGHFWVLNIDPASFVQIDASTGAIVRQIAPPFSDVGGFAVDGDALWVTDYAHPMLAKVDIPFGREVERFDLTEQIDDGSDGFAGVVVGNGSLWLMGKGRSQVFRVDPTSGAIQAEVKDVLGDWTAAYADGSVWAAAFLGLNRIDTTTNAVLHTDVPQGLVGAGGVAVGAGFGWTADESKGIVYKVDANGTIVATYPTGLGARSVSFSDGTLWVANQDVGTVSGIDAITGSISTLSFGHPIQAVAAGSGSVLVLLSEGRSYEDRIDGLQGSVARLFIQGYDFDTPDPAVAWSREAFLVEQATCATLVRHSDAPGAGGDIEPEIAAAMPIISADGRTYRFEVRSGFRFSEPSGEPVTAETFRYSIERALSPRLGERAPGPQYIDDIEGEQAFRDGEAEHITGLVVDGESVSITLTEPSTDFLDRLAMPFFCPVPLDTPLVPGGAVRRATSPTGTISTVPSAGPYFISDALNGEYVILARNANYDGDRPHAFDAIALREGVNAGSALSRVQSGAWDGVVELYDQTLGANGELARQWGPGSASAADGDQRYYAVPDGGVLYIMFNAGRLPFSDRELRRAVSLALDRVALSAVYSTWTNGPVPWDRVLAPAVVVSPAGPPDPQQPDLDAARTLAAAAAGATVSLVITDGCEECAAAAIRVVADLRAIDLDVVVERVPDSVAAIHEPQAPYDMKIGGSWPDHPDPASFVARILGEHIPTEWLPSSLSGVADRLMTAMDERREAAVAVVDGPIADEVPLTVFGYTANGAFFGPRVGCLAFSPTSIPDLAALCPKA